VSVNKRWGNGSAAEVSDFTGVSIAPANHATIGDRD
jgi:hypothetical protein